MRKFYFTLWLALIALSGVSTASGQSGSESQGSQTVVWLPLVVSSPADSNPIHQGIATYYNATGAGARMFDPSPQDLMVSAMNAEEYDNAGACGAYLHVVRLKGEVTVRTWIYARSAGLVTSTRAGRLSPRSLICRRGGYPSPGSWSVRP